SESYGLIQWGIDGDAPQSMDVDGDAITDFVVFRPANGTWYMLTSKTHYDYSSTSGVQWALPNDVPAPNDFNGDGLADAPGWRPSTGEWFIRFTPYTALNYWYFQWGLPGDMPLHK